MKRIFYLFSVMMIIGSASCSSSAKQEKAEAEPVAVDSVQQNDGWITLFDGTSLKGWRGYNRADMPKAWTIEDGCLKINGSGNGEAGAKDGGDIIFDQKFKNFELSFEYKVTKGANSGVFYLAQEVEGEPIYKSAPEYQILDNANHPDALLGKDNNRQAASLYDMIPAKPQNAKPFGEWNTGGVLVYQGTVVHKQNGENVVEYHLWTDDWKKMVDGCKFKGVESFINIGGADHDGYIGLQDHGNDVYYRNIKIRVIE
ncbi:MAG: DUF1080 domain-containing protein [Bacteroidales bacterium]|nr:DUF1080 domain-containing protein [Bacteroidales bacterium]MDD4821501.1 DUF1080 domain-containing protein [Bacteroidales bacterium]